MGVGAWGIAFAVIAFFSSSAPAIAESSFPAKQADRLHALGRAAPTWAWIRFCQKQPQECRIDRSQPERIALTPSAWAILQKVNEHVNATVLAVTDQDHWGVFDRWDYPDDGLGDCEDIQLLKRRLLVQAGLPQRALRIAAVIDEQGQGHAVLMVLTDQGDFILDNKRDAVLPWRQTGYSYIKRESTNARTWVALGDQATPAFTANR
ncbi:transglutaminase [Microvirga vignae]|uniref:Transglutaminase n=1 Tax=Microvirga vignae TaxID=1225564 RepID=A0A0H1R4J7_9HYPH|nr:transglutaminase [Microvirga vignae]